MLRWSIPATRTTSSARSGPTPRSSTAETLGNPDITVFPFAEVATIAKENAIPLMIDNTFATPYLCRPFEWGANIVVHSTTKFLGGHGTSIGGMIVDGGNFDWASGRFPTSQIPIRATTAWSTHLGAPAFILKARVQVLRDVGASQSPFNSWVTLLGVETLSLRMDRHVSQRAAGCRVPGESRQGASGLPIRAWPAAVTMRLRSDICLREQEPSWASASRAGRRGRPEIHRKPATVQPPGQCGRCQKPGDPPGQHHSQPAQRGTDGFRRSDAGFRSPEHRT